MSVPRLAIFDSTYPLAPWMSVITKISEVTPMIRPSRVRAVRNLCAESAAIASRNVSRSRMRVPTSSYRTDGLARSIGSCGHRQWENAPTTRRHPLARAEQESPHSKSRWRRCDGGQAIIIESLQACPSAFGGLRVKGGNALAKAVKLTAMVKAAG